MFEILEWQQQLKQLIVPCCNVFLVTIVVVRESRKVGLSSTCVCEAVKSRKPTPWTRFDQCVCES